MAFLCVRSKLLEIIIKIICIFTDKHGNPGFKTNMSIGS
jgi:hypothetical protein